MMRGRRDSGPSRDSARREPPEEMECTGQALSSVDQDGEKRRWYLEREGDDDRVQRALDELDEME